MYGFAPLSGSAPLGGSLTSRAFRLLSPAGVVAPVTGDFWEGIYQAANASTATTQFNDGTSGDQTTFEQVTGAVGQLIGITGTRVLASSSGFNTISFKVWVTDTITFVVERWTGSAWSTDWYASAPLAPGILGGGEWASVTVNINPALTTTKFRVCVQTQGTVVASNVKLSDIRTT